METRRLNPVAVTPLGLFHHELIRQRAVFLEAEHRDDQNRLGRLSRNRLYFRARRRRVTSITVRLANFYRSGRKQIELTNLFREAVQSIRGDGTAGVILPILESAFKTHKALVCGVADGGVPSLLVEEHRKATQRLQEFLPVAGHVADESEVKKRKPTATTVAIIRAIQSGKCNDDVVAATGCSVDVVRGVRSKLKAGKYEI